MPVWARYGAQTQRAVDNFPISGEAVDLRIVHAIARIKHAAAAVNATLAEVPGVTDEIAAAIMTTAEEVASGAWDDHFPVDWFQTGSGTSTNMNVNEVVSTVASERSGLAVHPNDHVNASQSSNDVFPSAVRLAVLEAVTVDLLPALAHLAEALRGRAEVFATVVKAGRTHLMDATPVTLGQEFAGYAAQLSQAIERLEGCAPRVGELPLGGTAAGTGINAPLGFAATVIERLADQTGLPLREAEDHFAVQGAQDSLVELSGQLRGAAVALMKIANDIRWMASGPRAGLAEIRLPALQPGSSIMPGKVNPVMAEVVTQVAVQVMGNDTAVAIAGSQGNFELNVFLPVIARNLLSSVDLMTAASRAFADSCVAGIEADVERCRSYAEATAAVATALNPLIGYEAASGVVKEAVASGRTVRDVVTERGLVAADELDRALDVLWMTKGGVTG